MLVASKDEYEELVSESKKYNIEFKVEKVISNQEFELKPPIFIPTI